ncbi:MAG: hypothetical protein VYE46_04200 [Cyanobacteriota bacterium]|nr:hypothetical protein [Cyanobacteriota bacterium]
MQSLASLGGHQRGLTVDWRWDVIHQEKNLMPCLRELDRLKARVQALRQRAEAPFISIDVWHEDDVPPDPMP